MNAQAFTQQLPPVIVPQFAQFVKTGIRAKKSLEKMILHFQQDAAFVTAQFLHRSVVSSFC
jgi:hypothetical protein